MACLKAKGQGDYLPSFTKDAHLGYSATAHESAEIISSSCEGDGPILVRLEASRTRAHPGARTQLAQRTKVGYCT